MGGSSVGQTFYTAVEMERRAVRMYERALLLFSGACEGLIRDILSQEREHLRRFTEMGGRCGGFEECALLSARAADVLFSGGLIEMQRVGAFDSPQSLLRFAAGEEQGAIEQYAAFAENAEGEYKQAFLEIAGEEKKHLLSLQQMLKDL